MDALKIKNKIEFKIKKIKNVIRVISKQNGKKRWNGTFKFAFKMNRRNTAFYWKA